MSKGFVRTVVVKPPMHPAIDWISRYDVPSGHTLCSLSENRKKASHQQEKLKSDQSNEISDEITERHFVIIPL